MLTYLQYLAMNPLALRSLAEDHCQILLEEGPTKGDLERAPLIKNWKLLRSRSRRLAGTLESGEKLNENTSLIWSINLACGWARTTQGFYRLAQSEITGIEDLGAKRIQGIGRAQLLDF
ncbi:hypothetical protein [Methylobacterium fujisawaense]|uniref:hypothetical protein n=1 Tax=Methylobacterium fujisawaense TaxID=107400 RepID=UPI00313F0360